MSGVRVARGAWAAAGVLLAIRHAAPAGGADVALDDERVLVVETAGDGEVDQEAVTDLATFVREELAPLPEAVRARVVERLARLTALDPPPPGLADGLHLVRESLRERRPLSVVESDRSLEISRLHHIADDAFYVAGRGMPCLQLVAVAPEGERVELLPGAALWDDGDATAFICHFGTRTPSRRAEGWTFEAIDATGRGVETGAAIASDTRAAIVADAGMEVPGAERLRREHVGPALVRLQDERNARVVIDGTETFGRPPAQPQVSVIVPLHRRMDLLEHQLAQFSLDEAMRRCQLLYVCDSPDQRDHVRFLSRELHRLYGLPFTLVLLSGHGGVNIARNRGAQLAGARRLLFLDSDVLPLAPRWLPELLSAWDAEGACGALAPKLLFHDGAVQQAGLVLERAEDADEWEARPRARGLHAHAAVADAAGPAAAVSGSCLLTDRELFRELGGMDHHYVDGGYEDVDYCLRAAAAGRPPTYAPTVSLVHLEAQSLPHEERPPLMRFNRWLLAQKHRPLLDHAA